MSWEIEQLRERLAEAQRGSKFLLMGGDCAETFEECESDKIAKKLKILLQMSLVLLHGLKKPIIRVGRMAGQYAKPRSADTETRNGVTLPAFRGDLVNRSEFTAEAREPDPTLLLRGYERAALTLNFVRALCDGGFADLHHPRYWDLGFMKHSPLIEQYQKIVDSIGDSLDFFERVSGGRAPHEVTAVDFFAAHEGLLMHYEQAQTRYIERQKRWYNLSTHMPWIGMRTAALDGAHVEFFRGIANPMGVKIGPAMTAEWLQGLVTTLNPNNTPGRLTIIHRFGAKDVEKGLPQDDQGGARDRPAGAVGLRSRCTATPRPAPAASRRAASRTSSRSSSCRSRSTRPMARSWAACTSSSRAKTSPNAPAARAVSPMRISRVHTSRPSTRASTTNRRSNWRC